MSRAPAFQPPHRTLTRATEPVIRATVDGARLVLEHAAPAERGEPRTPLAAYTGCRADTLFGVWLYPPEHFEPMFAAAWAIVENGELEVYATRSAAMREARDAGPLVAVDSDGIAHVSISGPLSKGETSLSAAFGGTSYLRLRDQVHEIRQAYADGKIRGVFFDVDTHGGTAEGAAEAAHAIAKLSELMPTAAHAEDKANSGGLWLATQAGTFTAGRAAQVGSQGAIIQLIDRSKNFERQGLRPVIVTTGPEKGLAAAGLEISDEHRAILQKRVEAVNAPFAADVRAARKLSDDQAKEVASAAIYFGADARRVGLIDEVCTRAEAYDAFRRAVSEHEGRRDRGRVGPVTTHPAQGDPTMPAMFTDQQIARVKALNLPGCAGVTADNAPEVTTAAAEHAAREIATRDTTIQTLTTERDTARANARPAAPAAELVTARARAARATVENLVLQGKVSPAMAATINSDTIGEAGKEKVENFTGADGATVCDQVLAVFAQAPKVGPAAGHAPANVAPVLPWLQPQTSAAHAGAGQPTGTSPAGAAPAANVAPVPDPAGQPAPGTPAALAAAGVAQGQQYAAEKLRMQQQFAPAAPAGR